MTPVEVAQALLDCALPAVNLPDVPIHRHGIVPGEIVWDDCQCGQLVISENRRYTSNAFPLEDISNVPECGNGWLVVDFTLSLTRCVPVGQNGNPPKPEQLQAAAERLMTDKALIRAAVDCCLNTMYDDHESDVAGFQVGAQETVGPQGGCAGSETQILVGFLNPCGC